MTWIKGHLGVCLCLILIMVACLLWIVRESSDRYIIAKGDNGVVYRTDRRTGETVMIRGTVMRPVGEYHASVAKEVRDLSAEELSKITGRAGQGYSPTYFSGSIYNGNEGIDLISVKIGLTHLDGKRSKFEREYTYSFSVGMGRALSSSDFGFSFVRGEEPQGYQYPWRIISARGTLK